MGKSKNKRKSCFNLLHPTCQKQLLGIDFIGGTLVEYIKTGGEFRGTITRFAVRGNAFSIDTKESDECKELFKLGLAHLRSIDSRIMLKQNSVWYIETGSLLGWMCAIAPKGVEIPNRNK